MKNKNLKTKRLIIMPLSNEELEKEIQVQTDEHLKKAYSEMLEGCKANESDRIWYTLWKISLKDSQKKIGMLSFMGRPENGSVEIGYGIDKAYQHQGYGTEAVSEAVEWALSQTNVYAVSAVTETENGPSKQLLRKLKFVQLQRTEEYTTFERQRPKPLWKAIYVLFGLSIGYSIGLCLDGNKNLSMVVGMAIGFVLGFLMDAADNKKRTKLRNGEMTQ